jgi:hypothetical protein
MDIRAGKLSAGLMHKKKPFNDAEYEYIYHNIVLPYDYNNSVSFQKAEYSANLNIPLLDVPSEWEYAVARSNLDTTELPLLIPQVSAGLTNWYVTLVYSPNGNEYQVQVPWISRGTELDIQFYATYGVYSYQHVADMFNAALATATGLLNVSSKFSYVVTKAEYDQDIVGHALIRFNLNIEDIFQGFDYYLDSSKINQELQLIAVTRSNNNYPDRYDNTETLFQIMQEYISLETWNPVASVQIRTGMPFRSQFIPQDFASRDSLNGATIIRDYIPVLSSQNLTIRSSIISTTDEFEWNNIVGSSPLKHITAAFYWQDLYGQSYQMVLTKHTVNSIKLVFRRKLASVQT